LHGYLSEGRGWLHDMLTAAESGSSLSHTVERAKGLYGEGGFAWAQGDYATAHVLLAESLAIYRGLGDRHGMAHALSYLGLVALSLATPAEAQALCRESVALFREVRDQWGEAFAVRCLGDAALLSGDPAGARSFYEESLSLWRQVGDPWGTATPLNDLGRLASMQNDFASARTYYLESEALFHQVGDKWGLALVLANLGYATLHQDDPKRARAAFEECLSLWRELGNRTGVMQCLLGFAGLAATLKQPDRAARLLGAADAQFKAIGFHLEGTTGAEFNWIMTMCRAQLDEVAWSAARDAGRMMTLEEAVGYALGDTHASTPIASTRTAELRKTRPLL
jgi:tetratricopeptide (TPR) repeat protein